MSVKDYISSGNIELYVLGMLDEGSKQELHSLAAKHVEVSEAIKKAEKDMLAIDNALEYIPSEAVKTKLFGNLTTASGNEQHLKIEKTSKDLSLWPKLAIAASISVACISTYFAIEYRQLWRESENNFISLQTQNQVLADQVEKTQLKLDDNASFIAALTETETVEIILSGTPYQPSGSAKVFFNPKKQEVLLSVLSLASLGTEYDFQLWAIVDGKPVDIGLVNLTEASILQRMKPITGASAFAITVEPKGGSLQPTLDQMVVFGAV